MSLPSLVCVGEAVDDSTMPRKWRSVAPVSMARSYLNVALLLVVDITRGAE